MLESFPFSATTMTTFTLAWVIIVAVPGPTITVIVANALRAGPVAGLATVAGTQTAVLSMIVILAFGLETILASFATVLIWIKFIGAAYLCWLGVKLWISSTRETGTLVVSGIGEQLPQRPDLWKFFWHEFAVLWSNPKAFVFFGAFIPQFVTPGGDTTSQVLILGALAMLIGTIIDGCYAVLAGNAGRLLTRERIRWTERIAGTFLIGGGIWLALSQQI